MWMKKMRKSGVVWSNERIHVQVHVWYMRACQQFKFTYNRLIVVTLWTVFFFFLFATKMHNAIELLITMITYLIKLIRVNGISAHEWRR